MELRERKLINNTKRFPRYAAGKNPYVVGSPQWKAWNEQQAGGAVQNATPDAVLNAAQGTTSGIGVNGVMSMIGQGLDFYGSLQNASTYGKSSNQLIAEGGTSNGEVGGIGYETLNGPSSSEMDEVNALNKANTLGTAAKGAALGATVGSVVPGVGTVAGAIIGGGAGLIGGLLGGSSRKKEAERKIKLAREYANTVNKSRLQGATFTAVDDAYREKYGNTENTILHAYNGKDVISASGRKAKLNAWLSKGEYVWDGGNNIAYVDYGPNDRAKGYVNGKDTVFTNNPNIPAPAGFNTIAQAVPYAAATGQLPALANYQAAVKGYGNYKNGKCASYKCGKISAYDGYPDPRRIAMYGELDPVVVTGKNRSRNNMPVGEYGNVRQLGDLNYIDIPQLAQQYRSNVIADTKKARRAKGSAPSNMPKASARELATMPMLEPDVFNNPYYIDNTSKANKAGGSSVSQMPAQALYDRAARAVLEPSDWNTAMQPIYNPAPTTKASRASNSMPSELPMRQLYNQQSSPVPQMMQTQMIPNTDKVNMSIGENIPADRIQTFDGDYDRSYAFKWGPQIHDWLPTKDRAIATAAKNPRVSSDLVETFEPDYGQFPTGTKSDFGGVNWAVPEYETKYNMLTPNRDLAQRMTAPEVKTDLNSRTVGFLPPTMSDFGGVNWAVPSPEQIGTSPYGAQKGNPTVGDPTAQQGPSEFAADKQAAYPNADTFVDAPNINPVNGVQMKAPTVPNNLNNVQLPDSINVKMNKLKTPKTNPANNNAGGNGGNPGNGNSNKGGNGGTGSTFGGFNLSGVDWGTLIPRGLGMLNALIGYNNTKREPVHYQNNYVPNTMGRRALSRMAGNKMNYYPILDDINKRGAYGRNAIARSGGLTANQKLLANLANVRNTQDARANALSDIWNKNAQLSNQLSNAELQYGAQEAQNMMNSKNLAEDRYARGLAAKRGMLRTYETDMSNNLQRLFADTRNYGMLNKMLQSYLA